MASSKTAPTPGTYQVRDILPADREFTKTDQLRVATQISRLLTQTGGHMERTGKK